MECNYKHIIALILSSALLYRALPGQNTVNRPQYGDVAEYELQVHGFTQELIHNIESPWPLHTEGSHSTINHTYTHAHSTAHETMRDTHIATFSPQGIHINSIITHMVWKSLKGTFQCVMFVPGTLPQYNSKLGWGVYLTLTWYTYVCTCLKIVENCLCNTFQKAFCPLQSESECHKVMVKDVKNDHRQLNVLCFSQLALRTRQGDHSKRWQTLSQLNQAKLCQSVCARA